MYPGRPRLITAVVLTLPTESAPGIPVSGTPVFGFGGQSDAVK